VRVADGTVAPQVFVTMRATGGVDVSSELTRRYFVKNTFTTISTVALPTWMTALPTVRPRLATSWIRESTFCMGGFLLERR